MNTIAATKTHKNWWDIHGTYLSVFFLLKLTHPLFIIIMRRGMVVFSGSSHPSLTDDICQQLSCYPAQRCLSKFSNNETRFELHEEDVRDKGVFIVQSGSSQQHQVNDYLMELLTMIHACKAASAKKIVAVLPFFPYSRQPNIPYTTATGAPSSPSTTTTTPASPSTISNSSYPPNYRYRFARGGTLVANLLMCAGKWSCFWKDCYVCM